MGGSSRMLNMIKTFDGSNALKNNCRHILGIYYEMNRQCFMMTDGKWHRVNNGKIVKDIEIDKWVLKGNSRVQEGIIGIDEKGNHEMGHFSLNKVKNTKLYTSNRDVFYVFDSKILLDNKDIVESPGTGYFYTKEYIKSHPSVLKKRINKYKLELDYSARTSINEFSKEFNRYIEITLGHIKSSQLFFKEIEGIKFGFEFETWNGTVPERTVKQAGLIPLRDGSLTHDGIRSYEYATIPFSGLNGLKAVKNACELLTRYTEISPMCSTHIHISGYKVSKEFVVSLYILSKQLENDIFNLFPKWFEDTSNFKGKNYCGKLPDLGIILANSTESAFDEIYGWLVSNPRDFPFTGFNEGNHPSDPGNHSKWNIPGRYAFINFVPFIWGSSKTIEFRVHPPTTNSVKAINWLFITNAILKFVDTHLWKDIYKSKKRITLNEVISYVYSNRLSTYLIKYMDDLKQSRVKMDMVEDYTGIAWCKQDSKYKFSHNKVKELI